MSRNENLGKLLLRLGVGAIVLFHGIAKLSHGVEWMKGPLSEISLPGFLAYGAFVGEVIAPILIILGYRTRIGALLVAFDLFMAIVLVLRHQIFSIKPMGGGWAIELEALIILASLAVFFVGGGKFGITKAKNPWD